MPELPAVEKGRRILEKHAQGKVISDVDPFEKGGGQREKRFDARVLGKSVASPAEFQEQLVSRRVESVERHGKFLWLTLSPSGSESLRHPILHFGMTGAVVVRGGESIHYKFPQLSVSSSQHSWPPRHCKVEITLDDGTQVAYVNARRLGGIWFHSSPSQFIRERNLGFDPYKSMPSLSIFNQLLQERRSSTIKSILMGQTFCAGLGNWMVDEILYQSKVHPGTTVLNLSASEAADLHYWTEQVTSVATNVDADWSRLPCEWLFHHRRPKNSRTPVDYFGNLILFETVANRTSVIVPATLTKKFPQERSRAQYQSDDGRQTPKRNSRKRGLGG
eukprot:gb/GECG01004187.1/.p1 GENE.gb/GECG01004187.1/~~gb/GECG01004187.1/.p1  ORF type:complete len:333 (+),score=26.54 gb/GECG01004187.1/:1-999(+)